VTELFGYFIDVTEVQREAAAREATASIKASAEQWSGIEQAKGVLMVVYGIEDQAAMSVLREASNRSNVAVRDLAYSLVHLFSGSDVTVVPTKDAIEEFLAHPILPDDL
jgi:hypothetical protein